MSNIRLNLEWRHPQQGRHMHVGWVKIGDFWTISPYISAVPTVWLWSQNFQMVTWPWLRTFSILGVVCLFSARTCYHIWRHKRRRKMSTRSSAIAEGPRDALCQLNTSQMLYNKSHIWNGLQYMNDLISEFDVERSLSIWWSNDSLKVIGIVAVDYSISLASCGYKDFILHVSKILPHL